ncbi:MAG: hypothetical protein PHV98_00775 [Candidatus Omnitrophica bacterium]|nr:hypothetical protein [Candidatus Omnitrophota bacterium]
MIHDNENVGSPLVAYNDTEANIEALSATEGQIAYATDTKVFGFYDGTQWAWGLRIVGSGWAMDSGGNNRGEDALDLQITRYDDTQIASGYRSFIGSGYANKADKRYCVVVGGINNTATATYVGGGYCTVIGGNANYAGGYYGSSVVVGGRENRATGNKSTIVGGSYNDASGDYSFIGGGNDNTASGKYSFVPGGNQAKADKWAQQSHSSRDFNTVGDAQTSQLVSSNLTTDNTPTELFLDGVTGGSLRATIASDTTWAFEIIVTARRTDTDNESAGYYFLGVIDNNAGTTSLVGSVTKTVIAEDTAGWDVNVTADNANDALIITATGENSKTIQWVAFIRLIETTG